MRPAQWANRDAMQRGGYPSTARAASHLEAPPRAHSNGLLLQEVIVRWGPFGVEQDGPQRRYSTAHLAMVGLEGARMLDGKPRLGARSSGAASGVPGGMPPRIHWVTD